MRPIWGAKIQPIFEKTKTDGKKIELTVLTVLIELPELPVFFDDSPDFTQFICNFVG